MKGSIFYVTLPEVSEIMIGKAKSVKPVEILLIEDNPADVRLTVEALRDSRVHNHLSIVGDGVEAMAFLRREGKYDVAPYPDVILLDLNLPRKDGREVLAEIKSDEQLKHIPVIALTTSQAEEDVVRAYDLHVNCYLTKPPDLDQFFKVIRAIEEFWLVYVRLPRKERFSYEKKN
jgi:two-component system, chemotaxis family, response regulator Rcp1